MNDTCNFVHMKSCTNNSVIIFNESAFLSFSRYSSSASLLTCWTHWRHHSLTVRWVPDLWARKTRSVTLPLHRSACWKATWELTRAQKTSACRNTCAKPTKNVHQMSEAKASSASWEHTQQVSFSNVKPENPSKTFTKLVARDEAELTANKSISNVTKSKFVTQLLNKLILVLIEWNSVSSSLALTKNTSQLLDAHVEW